MVICAVSIGTIYYYDKRVLELSSQVDDYRKTAKYYERAYKLAVGRIGENGENSANSAEDQRIISDLDTINKTLISQIDALKLTISELKTQIYMGYKNGGMQ